MFKGFLIASQGEMACHAMSMAHNLVISSAVVSGGAFPE